MESNNSTRFITLFLIVLTLHSVVTLAQKEVKEKKESVLKEIISKQALYNIRFVSFDSSFTIYQKHTGDLFLSTNYSVKKILHSEHNTQFSVIGERTSKNMIIKKRSNYHQEFNPNKEDEIFHFPYNLEGEVKLLGKGIKPQLHQQGNFISYYIPTKKSIMIHKLSLPTKTYTISVKTSANPFFQPILKMQNEENIILYEQNSSGLGEVSVLNLETKEKTLLKKLGGYQQRLEMCLTNNNLYLFQSGYIESKTHLSSIVQFNPEMKTETPLYQAKLIDLGQIACNTEKNHIYFLKNFGTKEKKYFDVAKLNLQEKTVTRITQEDYITSLYEMDGRLIAVNDGVQMLLYGQNSLKKDGIPSMK